MAIVNIESVSIDYSDAFEYDGKFEYRGDTYSLSDFEYVDVNSFPWLAGWIGMVPMTMTSAILIRFEGGDYSTLDADVAYYYAD
jgi:hypothetical protein